MDLVEWISELATNSSPVELSLSNLANHRVSERLAGVFTKQLGLMLQNGIGLVDALELLKVKKDDVKLGEAIVLTMGMFLTRPDLHVSTLVQPALLLSLALPLYSVLGKV